jgi:hypothetical protein
LSKNLFVTGTKNELDGMRRQILYFFFVAAVLVAGACRKVDKAWTERYKRSARKDIDLYLVPAKYAVLESSWLNKTATARFDKAQLVEALGEYGRTLEDVKKNPAYSYAEKEGIATMTVGRISHSTAYDYDVQIPLAFYGKWFTPGENTQDAYQQHIAPTLAKILDVAAPDGITVSSLPVLSDEKSKPDIIVIAAIDQGGRGLLTTHKTAAPRIHELLSKSANFVNAEVGHLDAHTAVGHMAIGTGAFPVKSSVIGNTFFTQQKKNGKTKLTKAEIYATDDEAQVDTHDLKSHTLADVLNRTYAGKSVIVSQSYALRASVGMAGHGALDFNQETARAIAASNFVYWLDAVHSRWITDTRYYSLPRVVAASDVLLSYMKHYPAGFEGYQIRDKTTALENWGVMMSTPVETQLEGELIRAVITEEILTKKKDKDGAPDLVYVSFKSADAVGHHFGYHSLEARETLTAIDTQIGALQDFLHKQYADRFILVLTADHGCAPLSEISGGARLTVEEVMAQIDSLLPPKIAKEQSLVNFMTVGQISLNHALREKYHISLQAIQQKILSMKPDGRRFFDHVLLRKDLGLDN